MRKCLFDKMLAITLGDKNTRDVDVIKRDGNLGNWMTSVQILIAQVVENNG